jgi:CspA family cold shock protein
MKNGTVKFFDATKGFGFIKDHAGEGDFFVHIADGDEVEFELKEGKRGMQAANVRKV